MTNQPGNQTEETENVGGERFTDGLWRNFTKVSSLIWTFGIETTKSFIGSVRTNGRYKSVICTLASPVRAVIRLSVAALQFCDNAIARAIAPAPESSKPPSANGTAETERLAETDEPEFPITLVRFKRFLSGLVGMASTKNRDVSGDRRNRKRSHEDVSGDSCDDDDDGDNILTFDENKYRSDEDKSYIAPSESSNESLEFRRDSSLSDVDVSLTRDPVPCETNDRMEQTNGTERTAMPNDQQMPVGQLEQSGDGPPTVIDACDIHGACTDQTQESQ